MGSNPTFPISCTGLIDKGFQNEPPCASGLFEAAWRRRPDNLFLTADENFAGTACVGVMIALNPAPR